MTFLIDDAASVWPAIKPFHCPTCTVRTNRYTGFTVWCQKFSAIFLEITQTGQRFECFGVFGYPNDWGVASC